MLSRSSSHIARGRISTVMSHCSSSSMNHNATASFSSSAARPLKIALLGAPGVGKGTFAARIGPKYNIPFISTGDLVRAEIKSGSELGKQIKQTSEKGGLVSDDIITQMLIKRLQQDDTKNGFLLDGYPRRVTQAEQLAKFTDLDLVLDFELADKFLVMKISERRVCEKCGTNFNLADINEGDIVMPPLKPKLHGVCDKCSGKLFQRADDEESIVRNRLEVYKRETFPLLEFYRKRGNLQVWNVKKGLGDVPALLEVIDKYLKGRGLVR